MKALRDVSDQAQRAGGIIHRLHAFVSHSAPRRKTNEIGPMTREVADLLSVEIRQHQVQMDMQVPGDLPPVLADRIQVQQVLLNLMRNSIEAMAENKPRERSLTVAASRNGRGMVEVAVVDNGAACPPDALESIFDAFFTTKESGIGMGLSISRSIVDAHGGRMWAVPNPERGLTLHFTLPIADGESDEPDERP